MVAAALIKGRRFVLALAVPPLAVIGYFLLIQWQPRITVGPAAEQATASVSVGELQKSLAEDRRQLQVSENAQSALRTEVIRLRRAFQNGQVAKEQVVEAEQSFVAALRRVHDLRHAVTEADIAIT